ncbi:Ca-activated chloride channel family protein [Alteromonadaceae bacterium Bs31]|nr:Ca-activated chloride channel family protein [Alteromonadaceae bacterium Bs31]
MESLQHFHFIRPYWLLLIVPFAFLLWWQIKKADLLSQWRGHIAEHLLQHMIVAGNNKQFFSPLWILAFIIIILSAALAGPSWQQRPSPFSEDNAALVIAVDLSESMEQQDIQPSRIQRAKQKIQDLLEKRGDAYTALLAYAGSAHTIIPLCDDKNVLAHYLDALNVGILPREGKAPEEVLPLLDELLKNTASPATILFITDGATELSAEKFQGYFSNSPHQLLIWAVGQTAGDDSEFDSNIIPLQESLLQGLAKAGDGYYQALTINKDDVDSIYRRINRAFLAAEDDSRPWLDAGYYLVWPLALMYLLWFRRGWTLKW